MHVIFACCLPRFLRVVAYRQFTRQVHGQLRDRRILLPSCTYIAIRSRYAPEDDLFTGYDDLELEDKNQ